jgi:hypothetical protein
MIKTQAGERKRTVTVVIGPQTAFIIDEIIAAHSRQCAGFTVTRTDIAGVSLDFGLSSLAWDRGVLPREKMVRHFE